MGAEESTVSQNMQRDFQQNYQLYRTEYDQRFGEIQVFKHSQTGDLVMLKEKWFQTKQEYEQFTQRAQQRTSIDLTHVASVKYL